MTSNTTPPKTKRRAARMRPALVALIALLSVGAALPSAARKASDARAIVERMLQTIGGAGKLHELRDAEMTYTYRRVGDGTEDVSLERYIFDGELSWARYDKHEVFVLPGTEGPVTSFFDGAETVSKHAGKRVEGEAAMPLAFLRKTNFYWFAMFFKLADPGVNLEYLGQREAHDTQYDVVQVTFGESVGDSPQDRYVLYVNPYTHLVDMFLFNVTGFGRTEPLLMEVRYTQVDGALLPAWRRYQPAVGWDSHAVQPGGDVVLELTEDIRFGNGFTAKDFELR